MLKPTTDALQMRWFPVTDETTGRTRMEARWQAAGVPVNPARTPRSTATPDLAARASRAA